MPFFLRIARAIALTISTIGIMDIASAIAMPYSAPSSFASSNAFARKGTSTTRVVNSSDNTPAPHNHRFCFLI